MPKMSAEYLEQKRNSFLDAAYKVCMKKPMYEVSMRDIISAAGGSQGNIYRYYSNLDEVLIALINRESVHCDIKALTDEAISSCQTPEKVIFDIFSVWEKAVLVNLVGIGKIYYELSVIYVSDKERLSRFTSNIHFSSNEGYLWEKLYDFIMQKISEGYFKPKLPIDDIVKFHVTSIDGITRDLILCNHYQMPLPIPGTLKTEELIRNLCTAFLLLLGGNEKIIFEEKSL